MLAGQPARRQRQDNDSSLIKPLAHRWLAGLFILTALAGCNPVTTGQKQAPYAPYSPDPNGEYPRDRGGDGSGGGEM